MIDDTRLQLFDLAARLFIYVVLAAIAFGLVTQSVVIGIIMFALLYSAPLMAGYIWLERRKPTPERIEEMERWIVEWDAQKGQVSRD